jgi:hypothetical protein
MMVLEMLILQSFRSTTKNISGRTGLQNLLVNDFDEVASWEQFHITHLDHG